MEEISLESEKIILATIINHPNSILEIDTLIDSNYFHNTLHKVIYIAIKEVTLELTHGKAQNRLDKNIIISKIATSNSRIYKLQENNINDLVEEIVNIEPTENIESHLNIIITAYIKQSTKSKLAQISNKIEVLDDGYAIVNHVENEIFGHTKDLFQTNDIELIGSDIEEHIARKIEKAQSNDKTIGIATGFEIYDRGIGGGFRKKSVHVIGARPKKGKSFLGANIAINVARKDIPVLYLDTELTKDYQQDRFLGITSKASFDRIEQNTFVNYQGDIDKITSAKEELLTLPVYHIVISGKDLSEQISIVRRWFTKIVRRDDDGNYNKALVILDYLKLMSPKDKSYNEKEYEALGYRMSALHDLMGDYQSSMLAFIQVNRQGAHEYETTTLAGSDRIAWLASSISIFAPKSPAEMAAKKEHNKQKGIVGLNPNRILKITDTRFGPGYEAEQIGVHFDLKDPDRQGLGCGKMVETGLETPWMDN